MSERNAKSDDVTRLLAAYADGDSRSLDEVVAIVYRELQTLARQQLRKSAVGQQVQTTVLVHEAYEKLAGGAIQRMNDRRHFFAIASRAMRQIVIDTYRADQAAKRGAGARRVTLTSHGLIDDDSPEHMLAVDEALTRLGEHDADLAELVDLACFAGLTTAQIAELNDTTVRTVQRNLKRAQAWLAHFVEAP